MKAQPTHHRSLGSHQDGAIMVAGVFFAVFMVAMLYYVVGVAEALLYRQRMQDAADAAALSSAVVHARGMNLIVLINMLMAALLTVLIALRLLEMVTTASIFIIGGMQLFFPALMAFVPVLVQTRTQAQTQHEAMMPQVKKMLGVLHSAARGVRAIVPAGSEVRVADMVLAHYRGPAAFGLAWVPRLTLPVEDDDFSVLCDRAGEYVGHAIMLPFKPFGDGLGDVVGSAFGGMTGNFSAWFCGAGGAGAQAPRFTQTFTQELPVLPKAAACEAYGAPGGTADPAGAQTCLEAEQEAVAAEARAGRTCIPARGCGPSHPYRQRLTLARQQCDPDRADDDLTGYWWIERRVVQHWVRTRSGWTEREETFGQSRLVKHDDSDTTQPCAPRGDQRFGAWNRTLTARGPDRWEPVCREEVSLPDPRDHPLGATTQITRIEVSQVLRCMQEVERELTPPDDPGDELRPQNNQGNEPQAVEAGVMLGEAPFQIRSVVLGQAPPLTGNTGVRIASWGRGTAQGAGYDVLRQLGRVGVAQAEYYFDGPPDTEPEEWMWQPRWRARLKRFRLPRSERPWQRETGGADGWNGAELPSSLTAACQQAERGAGAAENTRCASVQQDLGVIERFIVH